MWSKPDQVPHLDVFVLHDFTATSQRLSRELVFYSRVKLKDSFRDRAELQIQRALILTLETNSMSTTRLQSKHHQVVPVSPVVVQYLRDPQLQPSTNAPHGRLSAPERLLFSEIPRTSSRTLLLICCPLTSALIVRYWSFWRQFKALPIYTEINSGES